MHTVMREFPIERETPVAREWGEERILTHGVSSYFTSLCDEVEKVTLVKPVLKDE